MINLYVQEKDCCGCGACAEICPVTNIRMVENKEGFFFPQVVSQSSCINCRQCIQVCPIKAAVKLEQSDGMSKKYYAGVVKDKNIWERSSSGGIYSALCESLKEYQPVVFGARWDGLKVVMDCVEGAENIAPFCKSKYVAASPNAMFVRVKECCQKDEYVVFSGTPCQVNGLHRYLGKEYDRLLLVDFVCHGQGSPMVFGRWIDYLSKKHKSKVKAFSFREKKQIGDHINSNCCSYTLENGKKVVETRDYYHHGYVNGLCMRESCQNCPFAEQRKSDITLADFKNLRKGLPDYQGLENVSTIVVNTEKGRKSVERLRDVVLFKPDPAFVRQYNPKLWRMLEGNPNRKQFMAEAIEGNTPILSLLKKYVKLTLSEKVEYNCSTRTSELLFPVCSLIDRVCAKFKQLLKKGE